MTGATKIPNATEFAAAAREAFAFLGRYGFVEVDPPEHRRQNPFQVWFSVEDRSVVVVGEGYGTMASVTLEQDGRELAEIYLVPHDERPARSRKHQTPQLDQVREAARRVERFAADFLAGDLSRFAARAAPLPSYKQPWRTGSQAREFVAPGERGEGSVTLYTAGRLGTTRLATNTCTASPC